MSWANEENDSNPFQSKPAAAAPTNNNLAVRPPTPPSSSNLADADDTPSWLSSSPDPSASSTKPLQPQQQSSNKSSSKPAPAVPPPDNNTAAGRLQSSGMAEPKPTPNKDLSNPPRVIVYLRLINLLVSLGICVLATLVLLTSLASSDLSKSIMVFYVFAFSLMLCCFELQLKAISMYISANFGFFYSPPLRSTFLLFVSFLCYDFGLLGLIMAAGLTFCSVINLYAMCRYPEYISKDAISTEQKNGFVTSVAKAGAEAHWNAQGPGGSGDGENRV